MIATEFGEPRLVGDPTHHGWRLFLHNMARRSRLMLHRATGGLAFRSASVEGLGVRAVAELAPGTIRAIPVHEIGTLNVDGMRRWKGEQLSALSQAQMRAFSGEQIAAFATNPLLTADQFQRILLALVPLAHVGKVSVLLHALQDDPLEDRKMVVLADSLLNTFSRSEAQELLTVFSRAASDRQFELLVEALPFWYIQELADNELKNPRTEEFDRLDTRVEERQLSNSYRLMQLLRGFEAIEVLHQRLVNGELRDVDPKVAPWRSCSPKLVDALRVRIQRGIRAEEDLAEADRLMRLIKYDLTQKQIHLQTENCRVSGMLELWNRSYLDDCEMQAELLDKVVRPQAELLGDIAELLIFKYDGGDSSEEELAVLKQTLEQGCDLASTIAPEIRKAKRLMIQLDNDQEFLDGNNGTFLDLIRHETRMGRFSSEFFRRLLQLTDNDKAYHILHGDEFELLIVDNPQLADGIKLMQEVTNIQERVEDLQDRLKSLTRELSVEELSREMQRVVTSL